MNELCILGILNFIFTFKDEHNNIIIIKDYRTDLYSSANFEFASFTW